MKIYTTPYEWARRIKHGNICVYKGPLDCPIGEAVLCTDFEITGLHFRDNGLPTLLLALSEIEGLEWAPVPEDELMVLRVERKLL